MASRKAPESVVKLVERRIAQVKTELDQQHAKHRAGGQLDRMINAAAGEEAAKYARELAEYVGLPVPPWARRLLANLKNEEGRS